MTNCFHQVLQSTKDCKKIVLHAIEVSDPLPLFLSGCALPDWVVPPCLYRSDLFHVHIHVPEVAILEIADHVKQLLNVPATVGPWSTHLSALFSTLPLKPQKQSY